MKNKYNFQVQVDVEEETGRIVAVFFRVRSGRPAHAKEFADGAAFAHYNNRGELLGVELLAPCEIKVLDRIVARDAIVKQFIHRSIPREMELCA
jgi:hypothetical protein